MAAIKQTITDTQTDFIATLRDAEPFICARNVSVRFPLYRPIKEDDVARIGGAIMRDQKGRQWVHALNNISFDIRPGDRVGITGHNGAGKSTLLQVLAGTQAPASGQVAQRGKVARLLSPLAGMQMSASGYDNIKMRGMLQGMSDQEIEAAIPGIDEFTELGHYMHMPIAHYSGGMRLRLAFAVATAMKPDILLIDEWMGAGDRDFQAKAKERFDAFTKDASIFVLASHNPALLERFCQSAICLRKGEVEEIVDL